MWPTCWRKEPVTARVAATRKRKRASAPSGADTDPVPESKKGKTAGVAAVNVPVAPKLESRGSLFEIDEDSGPEIYD
jgi:hypothetical protein